MNIKAYKMDGLGNDFVIIDARSEEIELSNDQITKICDRDYIGCDQLIILKKNQNTDASLIFYNSDGSISGACGNGTRCIAEFLNKENKKETIVLTTSSGELISKILGDRLVSTEIGIPKLKWNEIPLSKDMNSKNLQIKISDKNGNDFIGGTAVNVGNPHVIFFVDDISKFEIKKIGPIIENSELFPEKCNVTIAQKINKDHIKVNVWERGAGLTKACGTAACATAYAGKINQLTGNNTDIEFASGKLSILIDDKESIHMKGPVSDIKEINIKI
ncbi:MAG: diaminopimelate epimerase [Proteobacteria bacterium]|jgi:diaminopimelate epimerase|nr:MAG: diaminopimelate epimerase [Pseudomonadota bacterium]|tara:strand:- start:131 stop:955 length:825 start_codon:yes stop_codon:yes gene_type:complete